MDDDKTKLHMVIPAELDRFLGVRAAHEGSNKSVVARRYLLEAMRREDDDGE